MDKETLERFTKIKNDPWEFAKHMVRTQDQIDLNNPIKAFPEDLEYLRFYFKLLQRERLLAVPKSRRMFLSWGTLIFYLHDTMFNVGRQLAVISRKEEDADDLIERMKFVLDNLRSDYIPLELIPKYKKTFCTLEFPEMSSRAIAFPSGADQLRSYAASSILADECGFWPEAKKMYSSTFPTIELTGRMTLISSAAPGFFKQLVHDEFDGPSYDELNPIQKKFPMEGVEVWKNPKNKFTVMQIHYTADPKKRDPKYRDTMKAGMPVSQFNQEFEISWDTFEGKVVFPDWNKTIHGSKTPLYPHVGSPIIIGVDFGLTPAAIFAQLQDKQLVVFDEIVTENMGAERFTDLIKRTIATNYPEWSETKKSVIMFIDPAGVQRSQSDETTCAQKLAKYFVPTPGPITFEERRSGIERFLCGMTKGKPDMLVDLTRCRILAAGFDGGYHFSEKAFEIEPNKIMPVKNEYSHPHDALQYLCGGIITKRNGRNVRIPDPKYLFERAGG